MPLNQQPLREEVYEIILEDILSGSFAPGRKISIDGLARNFNISQTPVREALVFLEHSGLVKYIPRKGYFLSPPLDTDHINELIDIRHIVEEAALSRSFSHWDQFSSELNRAHEEHQNLLADISQNEEITYELVRRHFKLDWKFHQVFFKYSKNRYLSDIINSLGTHTYRMRQTWDSPNHTIDASDAISEHQEILDKVLERNHDEALNALSKHLENVRIRSTQN